MRWKVVMALMVLGLMGILGSRKIYGECPEYCGEANCPADYVYSFWISEIYTCCSDPYSGLTCTVEALTLYELCIDNAEIQCCADPYQPVPECDACYSWACYDHIVTYADCSDCCMNSSICWNYPPQGCSCPGSCNITIEWWDWQAEGMETCSCLVTTMCGV